MPNSEHYTSIFPFEKFILSESMTTDIANTNSLAHISPRFMGEIVGLSGNLVHGWAKDVKFPEAAVIIEVVVDGNTAGVCIANQAQTSMEARGSYHGFSLALNESLLTTANRISARVANFAVDLGGTLAVLQAESAKQSQINVSQIWYSGGLVIGGWLQDPELPGKQLSVVVRESSRIIATARANRPHPSLVQKRSVEHGFVIELPWQIADGKPHELHLSDESGRPLSDSPITVACYPDGVSGLLPMLWPQDRGGKSSSRENLATLVTLARIQERFAPVSIGFSDYPVWYAMHTRHLSEKTLVNSSLQVSLLISNGPAEAVTYSLEASRRQRYSRVNTQVVGDNFRIGLETALQNGADLIVPLSAGDHLSSAYIDEVLEICARTKKRWIFTDCDQDDQLGNRGNPWLKPAWDLDLFLGLDVVTPGSAWAGSLLRETLDYFPSAQITDWQSLSVLVAQYLYTQSTIELDVTRKVGVLYHRSSSSNIQPYDTPRTKLCLQLLEGLANTIAPGARIKPSENNKNITQVVWPLPANPPLVSLIIPTRDQLQLLKTCIEGLLTRTSYPNIEIIVVDNLSTEASAVAYLEELRTRGIKVLRYPHQFNYSAINNFAAAHASGEVLGLLNNDIEILEPEWLEEMVSQLVRPGVGVVGAKLLWPNGMVQHGGVITGFSGLAIHYGNYSFKTDPGYMGLLQTTRRLSAVTAACLLVKKTLYIELNGLDENDFHVNFNDVDFCLRVNKSGMQVIFSPFAELIHHESATRGRDLSSEKAARSKREERHLREKWFPNNECDPFYHPGLTRSAAIGPYASLATCNINEDK